MLHPGDEVTLARVINEVLDKREAQARMRSVKWDEAEWLLDRADHVRKVSEMEASGIPLRVAHEYEPIAARTDDLVGEIAQYDARGEQVPDSMLEPVFVCVRDLRVLRKRYPDLTIPGLQQRLDTIERVLN